MNAAEYVRARYAVPARRGGRVRFEGRPGRITGFSGGYVLVRLDGEPMRGRPLICHPTWEMEYLPDEVTATGPKNATTART